MKLLWPRTILFALLCGTIAAYGEHGVLVIYVSDVHGKPVSELEIATNGDGGSDRTIKGKARIPLAPDQISNSVVTLHIASSPRGHNYVLISPWDGAVRVPPFENASGNSVTLVVAESGDRDLLTNRDALLAMTNRVVARTSLAAAPSAEHTLEEQRREALGVVAQLFSLQPDEIDKAIGELKANPRDPSEQALLQLYATHYEEASKLFSEAIERDKKEKAKWQDNEFE